MKLSSMLFNCISEATTRWLGPIDNTLGNGADWTINYGTGDPNRPPFLYINGSMSLIRSAVRDATNSLVVWANPDALQGKYLRIGRKTKEELASIEKSILTSEPNADITFYPQLTHVGESHATVSMAPELESALGGQQRILRALKTVKVNGEPLFDGQDNGQRSNVNIGRHDPYMVLRAGFFKDDVDTSGPLVLAINIECDLYYYAREALGLPRVFRFPNGNSWKQHLTVGYLPKKNRIHQSFVDRFGSSPREKRREATGSLVSAF